MASNITVNRLTPTVGAVIEGIDLGHDLDADEFAQVHDALIDNGVIFFRDQDISVEHRRPLAMRFGSWTSIPTTRASTGIPRS